VADQDVRTWNPAEHDAECEIENGAVGFDGIVCLCADRRKASAVIFVPSMARSDHVTVYARECARITESQRAPLQPIPVTASTVRRYARLMRLRGVEAGPDLGDGLAAVHPTAVFLNNLVLEELRHG
jgi:hypothetical protein